MIALICFVLAVLASPFKSKSRLEAENAVLRHRDRERGLSSALQIERKAHELMYGTQDMREGTNAFAEKRKPEFKGL
jgi:1,4-dihydroxy-2-naphthoyl-CoA synthase